MKTIFKHLLFVLVIFAAGCSKDNYSSQEEHLTLTGSGSIVSQDVIVSEFDRVEASLPFVITIHQGDAFSVVITSDDNFIDYIQVFQAGGSIHFDYQPGYAYDISGVTLQAAVTLPELKRLNLSGSSSVLLDGLAIKESLTAGLSGASILKGNLTANTVDLDVNGNSSVSLAGSGTSLQVASCGSSFLDLSKYKVKDASMEAGCVSKVIVNASEKLDISASGNAQAFYVIRPAFMDITTHQFAQVGLK